MNFLDKFESLTFNTDKITDFNKFVQEVVSKGYSVVNIIKSGFNEREFKEKYPVIQRGDIPYPYPMK